MCNNKHRLIEGYGRIQKYKNRKEKILSVKQSPIVSIRRESKDEEVDMKEDSSASISLYSSISESDYNQNTGENELSEKET